MILARYQNLPRGQISHRMIAPAMPVWQLDGFRPESQRQQLVTEAYSKGGQRRFHQFPDHRNYIIHRGGVTRSV